MASPVHVVVNVGRFSAGDTVILSHIPARPCPGTPQKIMYEPALLATNLIVSESPDASPCIKRPLIACGNAGGSTGPAGIGFAVSTTSAEWVRFGSWFLNRITTFQPAGTVSVSLPSLKPLKFRPPLSWVSPEVNWNVAVLAVVSTVSQLQSTCGFA